MLIKIARLYFDFESNFPAVVNYTSRVIKIEPKSTSALLLRAQSYERMKLNEKAIADCSTILNLQVSKVIRATVTRLKASIEKSMDDDYSFKEKRQSNASSQGKEHTKCSEHETTTQNPDIGADKEKPEPKNSTRYSFVPSEAKNISNYKTKLLKQVQSIHKSRLWLSKKTKMVARSLMRSDMRVRSIFTLQQSDYVQKNPHIYRTGQHAIWKWETINRHPLML